MSKTCATCMFFSPTEGELGTCYSEAEHDGLILHKESSCAWYEEKVTVEGAIEEWLPRALDGFQDVLLDYANDIIGNKEVDGAIRHLQGLICRWQEEAHSCCDHACQANMAKVEALREAGDAMADMLEYAERGHSTIELWRNAVRAIWDEGLALQKPKEPSITTEPNYGEGHDVVRQ